MNEKKQTKEGNHDIKESNQEVISRADNDKVSGEKSTKLIRNEKKCENKQILNQDNIDITQTEYSSDWKHNSY